MWGSPLRVLSALGWWRSIPTCVGQPDGTEAEGGLDRVYPHVCGAASHCESAPAHTQGLSPRVWGSLCRLFFSVSLSRSIPTCVGQPPKSRGLSTRERVYPHVCGAAVPARCVREQCGGLAPRVWGSLLVCRCPGCPIRSIPTCVGQPLGMSDSSLAHRVYPHVCGAASLPTLDSVLGGGLSPRVWGSLYPRCRWQSAAGSIPTCVGQPSMSSLLTATSWVYPHVCGAAKVMYLLKHNGLGLSPRVWGSHAARVIILLIKGSIPTCVGQPFSHGTLLLVEWVYPHVCGAAWAVRIDPFVVLGLSPRVWGSPGQDNIRPMQFRSIPTCVGQPLSGRGRGITSSVYPHVCGAALDFEREAVVGLGLSPRVWGSRIRVGSWYTTLGSIPTCVGQPHQEEASRAAGKVYPHVCGAAR